MMQGIVDDYILPNIANSTSLSFGLDLAGSELDTQADPRLADELPVGPLLPLVPLDARARSRCRHRRTRAASRRWSRSIPRTASRTATRSCSRPMVPKHEYQCFLASWLATGVPAVPSDASRDAPCP